jgi:signal transduction histidine kinase
VRRAVARRIERFDAVLVGTVLALSGLTVAMLALPGLRLRTVAPALDLTLDTVAMVVTGSIGVLAWVRYQERREAFALFQCAAFLSLAIANLHAVLVTIGPDGRSILLPTEPGQDQFYVFTVARIAAAAFLVFGGLATLHGRPLRHPLIVIGGAAALILAVIAWIDTAPASLGQLVSLPAVVDPGQQPIPSMTLTGAAVQLMSALLFASAAVVCRELWRRDRSVGDAYVTFGLVLAAFGQLLGVITADTHPGPVTSGDVLRLGFYLSLLLAIEAEARSILGALRRANQTLAQLHESEVERAALEERALLSRELHDGLAQDLWLAKLKVGRLAGLDLDPEVQTLAGEIGGAIELGLAEARQAVMALRIASESDDPFVDLLTKHVQDFEDRFGLRVEVECPSDLPTLPARTQAELLRIAQEALTNVRRHADATTVRVRVDAMSGRFRLSVVDNGRGFEQCAVQPTSFGLSAMRERAALIGGEIEISSAPGDGTRVQVTAPLA